MMYKNNEVFSRIVNFVILHRWYYDFPLTRTTELYKDLLIYGDDAEEFLQAFSKEFNVDISNFNIGEYFLNEGVHFFGKKKKVLTLADLEKAIETGKLS